MADQHVRCPGCGGKQPRKLRDSIYWCDKCRCQFDDDPDEGGDYSWDPTRRLEREERRAVRRSAKKRRR